MIEQLNKTAVQSVIVAGDVFSEVSHYKFKEVHPNNSAALIFEHIETGNQVAITDAYVRKCFISGDQFDEIRDVGKVDKYWTQAQINDAITSGSLEANTRVRPGDVRVKGIRTIFEEIYGSHVFTVCFTKQDEQMSKVKQKELREKQRQEALSIYDKAKKARKSTEAAVLSIIERLQNNPLITTIPGEERVLRGYKKQFSSSDGRYDCFDMDIKEVRPVNINTIKWLIYDRVKYVID